MANPSVTPTSTIAQETYEFIAHTTASTHNVIESIIEKLNIPEENHREITRAFFDIEKSAFLSGFAMCEAVRTVPMLSGDD